MRGVVMYGPGDVRVEDREDPKIIEPTDAIIRLSATCICGSDLWPYRGAEPVDHQVMGHEYVGVVEEIGSEVRNVKVGDFVVGSFWASDNTCEICRAGYQAYCVHRVLMGAHRHPVRARSRPAGRRHAGGHPGTARCRPDPLPDGRLRRARHRLVRRGRCRGGAREDGGGRRRRRRRAHGRARRQAARRRTDHRHVSRHADRQALAREFGATDIVEERGDEGVARIKDLTGGLGAHSVIEAVGTQEAMMQAIRSTRPGGHVGVRRRLPRRRDPR